MEGFAVACQLTPTVPHFVSDSCPLPRTCVPRFLQPPSWDALALPLSFGSTALFERNGTAEVSWSGQDDRLSARHTGSISLSGLSDAVRIVYAATQA
jgi:hypothetical protein